MPLYEFACRKCGHIFEELLTQSELQQTKPACPECASRRVERNLTSFATGSSGGGSAPMGGCGGGGFT